MKNRKNTSRGKAFLSGFANDNYLEDFFSNRVSGKSPISNFIEEEDRYRIEVGLSGYRKDNINVLVKNGQMLIKADRTNDLGKYVDEGFFSKNFRLPNDCDTDKIRAKFDKEFLKINIPKNGNHDQKIQEILIDVQQ